VSNNRLLGVAAIGPDDAWAVGSYDQQTSSHPLILRWNGTSWQSIAAPEPQGATNLRLNAVATISAADAWAVGAYLDASFNRRTLTMRWDGTAWKIVPSPNPNDFLNALNAVSAIAPDDVWAAGYTSDGTGYKTLTLHWDGASWQRVASPNAGAQFANNELLAVAAAGTGDVWAFGYSGASADDGQTLALHWDGASWKTVARPDEATGAIAAAARLPGGEVWAAGTDNTGGAAHTLVERYYAAHSTQVVYLPMVRRS
jgi:hypothetical protein